MVLACLHLQARGVSLGIDADLQGLGLMAKSSVNELFHFTLKRVQGTWMLTPVEGLVGCRLLVRRSTHVWDCTLRTAIDYFLQL